MLGESNSSTTTLAAIAAGVAFFLALAAMMPGMLLVILFGGGETELMPDEALVLARGAFIWPLEHYGTEYVTSRFGPRNTGIQGASTNHQGIDIGAPSGTPILASCGGVVLRSSYNNIRGYYVEIDHGNGLSTLYQHMTARECEKGDVIMQGEVIGRVGSSGVASGAHLHYEVRVNGTCYDPLQILNQERT